MKYLKKYNVDLDFDFTLINNPNIVTLT